MHSMGLEADIPRILGNLPGDFMDFPHRVCGIAALESQKFGYVIASGLLLLDNFGKIGLEVHHPHFWGYDAGTKRHFDITAGLWNGYLSKKNQLPDFLIWSGSHPLYVVGRIGLESVF